MADTTIKLSGTYDSIEAYELLEEMRETADNYLPLTGGEITGDLTVDGGIFGDLTGTAQNATNDGDGNNIASTYLPAVVGAVVAFAGSTSPDGWLLCDGSAVSRTTYAALFAVIGTTYGSGDGSTTFNLPNLTNKFIQGNATSGTVKAAGLPNITGTVTPMLPNNASGSYISLPMSTSGAFQSSSSGTRNYYSSAGTTTKNDWGWASSIYGNSTTVQPPALTMRYIIKY